MKNKRFYGIAAFVVWWGIWGMLITGFPFKIGGDKLYPPNEGCGNVPYVNKDINNIQRYNFVQWRKYVFGHQPYRGPWGTEFDMVNYRQGGKLPFQMAAMNSIQFGSVEMIERFYGPVNPQKVDLPNPAQVTKFIRNLGIYLGGCAVGIADLSPDPLKFFFTTDGIGNKLHYKAEENKYAIVCLSEEELGQPFPDGLSIDTVKYHTKVPKGYHHDDYVAGQMATFIRQLGYHAVGHNNGHVFTIPLAIKAGLGSFGRYGQLLTVKWGPNVRINVITTDLPLVPDKPIDIGTMDFCSMCTRCYDYCPARAIPIEKMDWNGVHKWKLNLYRCRRSTAVGNAYKIDAETCSICRDVCPWAKPHDTFINVLGRTVASRSHLGRKMLIKLDDWAESKWNKHNLREIVTERRDRLRESFKTLPDISVRWMKSGMDPVAQKAYANEINGDVKGLAGKRMFDSYSQEDMARPEFGKWPTWTDPWGRKIPGYEEGEKGAPRLDFDHIHKFIGRSSILSGGCTVVFGQKPPVTDPYFHGWNFADTNSNSYY